MPDTVAIVSIVTSGFVTPSIIAGYALRAQRRQEIRAEREHQITLLENALHNVTRQRRLMAIGVSLWLHGADPSYQPLIDNEFAVGEAIEAVSLSENQLQIRFGEHSPVSRGYDALQTALNGLKEVYDRHGLDRSLAATQQDMVDWQDAVDRFGQEQTAFIGTIHKHVA